MYKYRIKTAIRNTGFEHYQVQIKWCGLWWNLSKRHGVDGVIIRFYTLASAEDFLKQNIREDEEALALKKKLKAFKSKVVYGPYPP